MDNERQQASVRNSPSQKKSYLLIIGVIIVFVVGVINGYLLKPNNQTIYESTQQLAVTSPTSVKDDSALPTLHVENNKYLTDKWQKYNNTKVGFTFSFPATLSKMQEPTGPIEPTTNVSETADSGVGITDGFEFSFFPFTGNLDDLLTKRKVHIANDKGLSVIYPDDPIREIGNVEFNGITGKWYALGIDKYLHPDTEVHFIAKDHAFILRIVGNYKDAEKEINTYETEQLLSTFKLTK